LKKRKFKRKETGFEQARVSKWFWLLVKREMVRELTVPPRPPREILLKRWASAIPLPKLWFFEKPHFLFYVCMWIYIGMEWAVRLTRSWIWAPNWPSVFTLVCSELCCTVQPVGLFVITMCFWIFLKFLINFFIFLNCYNTLILKIIF
jgi:hypothetical protein